MEFLMQEVMVLGGFTIAVWHVIAAVAALVLLFVLFVGICQPKKKKQKPSSQTSQPTNDPIDEQVDDVIITIEDDSNDPTDTTDVVDEEPTETPTEDVVDDTVAPTVVEPAAAASSKKPTVKNYHISLRPDGKWQVKLSKGGKAIKLFKTQAEAIAFAKSRAKSQEGHITIHKVDGKIRKQKY